MGLSKPEVRQEILAYIRGHQVNTGYSPSLREIGDAVGLRSTHTVHYHLKSLEAEGRISRAPGKTRAITILKG